MQIEINAHDIPLSAIRNNNCHAAQVLISKGANIHHKNKILLNAFQCIEVSYFTIPVLDLPVKI